MRVSRCAARLVAHCAHAAECTSGVRSISTSAALQGLFGRRRRMTEADELVDGPKLTIFRQEALPDDLRLPTPADPVNRIGAGLFDGTVAGLGGAAAAAAVFYGAEAGQELCTAAGSGAALVLWALRDTLADDGTRSWGKKLFGLEITTRDGTLPTPLACALRSWYTLLVPLAGLHPFVGMSLDALLFADVATLAVTQDARKAGDYMLGTRVVNARPGRELREREAAEAAEIRALRARIEELSPGLLASRGKDKAWYEDTQAALAQAAALAPPRLPTPPAAAFSPAPGPASMSGAPAMPAGGLFSEVRGLGGEEDSAGASSAGEVSAPRGAMRTPSGQVLLDHKPIKR